VGLSDGADLTNCRVVLSVFNSSTLGVIRVVRSSEPGASQSDASLNLQSIGRNPKPIGRQMAEIFEFDTNEYFSLLSVFSVFGNITNRISNRSITSVSIDRTVAIRHAVGLYTVHTSYTIYCIMHGGT